MMLLHELWNKYPGIVPAEAHLVILDSKSSVCMYNNGNDTKQTRHIAIRINLVSSGEKFKIHNSDWRIKA